MSRKNPSRRARSLGATSTSQRTNRPHERKYGSIAAQVLWRTRLRTRPGCRSASSWAMRLPPEKPAMWAERMSSARRTPAASSAIVATETGPSGIAVRPAPRLSNAVSRYRSASPSSWNCHDSTVSPRPPIKSTSGPSPTCSVQTSSSPASTCSPTLGLLALAVPALHVLRMGGQVGARLEVMVVEVEVEVVSLDVVHDEDGRHRPRELAEVVEYVLGLQRDARLELVVVDLGAPAEARAVAPRAGRVAVEGSARTELALCERLHRRGHVGVVGRAVGLEDALAAGRVRRRPALVLVVAEAEAGDVGVARGPE